MLWQIPNYAFLRSLALSPGMSVKFLTKLVSALALHLK